MSDADTVTMSAECYDARLSAAYAVGCAATHEGLAAAFRKRAGELFADGHDALARYLRDTLADELDSAARVWRDRQKEQDAAADALEKEP